jgi:hypothetical protein
MPVMDSAVLGLPYIKTIKTLMELTSAAPAKPRKRSQSVTERKNHQQ